MKSLQIAKLEKELQIVREMAESDENALISSEMPDVDRIFFASSKKRRSDLEKLLYQAKSEHAHELIRLRMIGNQMNGSIRIRELVKVFEPLNSLLENCAWRIWDKEGKVEKLDEQFANILDLRLAGIVPGSTELQILGNTSPDLTGTSALEEGLKNIFELLAASNDQISDHVHSIGLAGCRSLSKFMNALEKRDIAIEFNWSGPDRNYFWEGRPAEVTRIRAILDDIGEPEVQKITFSGVIQVLSIRNRIEVYKIDTEEKLVLNYHRSMSKIIQELHLGQKLEFTVEKTIYPFKIAQRKKDAYTLSSISSSGFNLLDSIEA